VRNFHITTVWGIPIRVNVSLLIFLPVLAWIIGSGAQISVYAGIVSVLSGVTLDLTVLTAGQTPWLIGTAAAVGLFASVALHELGHAWAAMRYGLRVESITLWILGGLASLEAMPKEWNRELVIALAGPAVSVLTGLACYAALFALPASAQVTLFVVGWLAVTNLFLAVFNMLPAFPMDGGRVLRALLARNASHAEATQRAAAIGKAFAFVLAIVGLFSNWFLIFLALFIYIAASGEAQQTTLNAAFEGVTVADVMTPASELDVVTEETTVAELIDRMFRERHTGFPVMNGETLVGMVTLEDARGVDEVERDAYRVEDVMERDLVTVSPETEAMDALQTMQRNDVGRLPVVNAGGNLVGLVSRTDLMTAFNVIQNSGRPTAVAGRALGGDRGVPSIDR
jgi:Zn-dependent protease/CBS domain-containing protein